MEVRGVIFIGGGEPLVHRTTPEAMTTLLDAGVAVAVVTNGTHLDTLSADLLRRLSWIRVSVDAATASMYDMFRPSRGRSVYHRVMRNIDRACEAGACVGYSFLILSRRDSSGAVLSNLSELPAAGELAKALGCKYIEVKAAMTPDHFVDCEPLQDEARLRATIDLAQALADDDFAVLLSSGLTSLLRGESDQPKTYNWCPSAHLRTLITPTGVFACAYHRGNPAMRLGDVQTSPVSEVWRTAPVGAVNPSMSCHFHCARHETNLSCLDQDAREILSSSDEPDVDLFF